MSNFGDLEKKAEAYAKEHPEQADKGINEVSGIAESDTDHQHDEQIDRAVDAAQQHIGQGQDRGPGAQPELGGRRGAGHLTSSQAAPSPGRRAGSAARVLASLLSSTHCASALGVADGGRQVDRLLRSG